MAYDIDAPLALCVRRAIVVHACNELIDAYEKSVGNLAEFYPDLYLAKALLLTCDELNKSEMVPQDKDAIDAPVPAILKAAFTRLESTILQKEEANG